MVSRGVRHGPQPGGDRPVEVRLELRARYADLGPAEPEGDQALGAQPVVGGESRRLLGGLQARLAGDVEAPAQDGAEVRLGRLAGVLDGVHEGALVDAAPGGGEGGDGQLGVPHLLAGQVAGHLVGEQPDVLRGADQVHDRQVHVDEVGEVGEREVVDQRLGVGGHLGVGVAGGEFGDDTRGGRSDVVDVQFGLGQAGDEGVQGQGVLPGTAPRAARADGVRVIG
ncbi:hypothetical protein RKD18_005858 [Streptomyces phaeoluteigriseus]